MSLSMTSESDTNDEKCTSGFIDDRGENIGRRRASQRPLTKIDGISDFADPKPLQGRLGYGTLGALPSITTGAGALVDKKREAAIEIRKAQDQLSDQRKLEDDLRKQLGNINPDDAEKRAKHMAEQRDKLIFKKKAERDRRVNEEEERQAKLKADGDESIPGAVLRAKAKAQAEALSKIESKGGDAGDSDEKKRSAMRLALARRMKLDLIENEETKLAQMQEEQFADLDRKLLQVWSIKDFFVLKSYAKHYIGIICTFCLSPVLTHIEILYRHDLMSHKRYFINYYFFDILTLSLFLLLFSVATYIAIISFSAYLSSSG